jgi:hypothetical protein
MLSKEQKVCTQQQAVEFKNLGMPPTTDLYWLNGKLCNIRKDIEEPVNDLDIYGPAYDFIDLLHMFPKRIEVESECYRLSSDLFENIGFYSDDKQKWLSVNKIHLGHVLDGISIVEALADILLLCLKQNVFTAADCKNNFYNS